MAHDETELTDLAAGMRLAFDQTFSVAAADTSEAIERFLAIGIGGDYYALRLLEISGLFADKRIVPLPSRSSELLGITSFRGVVVPVYDLRSLLGYPAGLTPRWLALVGPDTPVALAFDHLDGYLDLLSEAVVKDVEREKMQQHVLKIFRDNNIVRSVIDTNSIIETIQRRG